MKRPAAELTNFESVYRYYEAHDQSKAFARFAHFVFGKVFRLDLSTGDGVEDAIRDALADGTRLIVSPNHITGDDQYVIVSLAEHLEVLHPLRGNTLHPLRTVALHPLGDRRQGAAPFGRRTRCAADVPPRGPQASRHRAHP